MSMPKRVISAGSRVRVAKGRGSEAVGVVMPASVLPKGRRLAKSEVVVAVDGTGRLLTTLKSALEVVPARHGDWFPGRAEPARPFPRAVTEPKRDAQGFVTYTFNFYGGFSASRLAERLRAVGVEAAAHGDGQVRGALRARDWQDAASRINRTLHARAIQTEFNLRATAPRN
jgi:hypothetical protein